jgi:recombination endonuclease VII
MAQQKDPERMPDETESQYIDRLARREALIAYQREYREKNRERISEKNRAKYQELKANPEAYAALLKDRKESYRRRYHEEDTIRAQRASPEWKEQHRNRERERYRSDPALRAKVSARHLELRAPPEDHPGTCDCCGVPVERRKNGKTGLNQEHRHDTGEIRGWTCHRCNLQVAVLDLRFTDPDRFALLMSWSNRGAPVTRVPVTNPARRRTPQKHPTLFESDDEG